MRSGEVCALTWDDIDFENRIIKINKTVYCKTKDNKGKGYLGTTKTIAVIEKFIFVILAFSII